MVFFLCYSFTQINSSRLRKFELINWNIRNKWQNCANLEHGYRNTYSYTFNTGKEILRGVHDQFCTFCNFHFTTGVYGVWNPKVWRFHRFSTCNVGIAESELEQIQVQQKHYRHHETIMFWKLGFIHFLFRKIMSYAVLSVILNANRFC